MKHNKTEIQKSQISGRGNRDDDVNRSVAERWTLKLTEKGWTGISNVFLESYSTLDPPVSYGEAMFVIHVMQHKWDQLAPFPAMSTIASRMGISVTAARSHARSLENSGYLIRREVAGYTNRYDFTPLFNALENRIDGRENNLAMSTTLVLKAWVEVEDLCRQLLQRHQKSKRVPDTWRAIGSRLKKLAIVDEEQMSEIDRLRKCRNLMAHACEAIVEFEERQFVESQSKLVAYLKGLIQRDETHSNQ